MMESITDCLGSEVSQIKLSNIVPSLNRRSSALLPQNFWNMADALLSSIGGPRSTVLRQSSGSSSSPIDVPGKSLRRGAGELTGQMKVLGVCGCTSVARFPRP